MVSSGQDFLSTLGIDIPAAPPSAPMPGMQMPMQRQMPQSQLPPVQPPAGPNPMVPAELPTIPNADDVFEHFYQSAGRRPTPSEVLAIRALPVLSRQLGRRPTKQELMGFLDSRSENPPTQAPVFEELR